MATDSNPEMTDDNADEPIQMPWWLQGQEHRIREIPIDPAYGMAMAMLVDRYGTPVGWVADGEGKVEVVVLDSAADAEELVAEFQTMVTEVEVTA